MPPQKPQSTTPKLTRSSRRLQGLAPFTKAVFLPPELKVAILAYLGKRDLKSVRTVSKEWSALATAPLFDGVYVSCRGRDMEVFREVTGRENLAGCVREVVYDGSLFGRDMEIDEYFAHLYGQLPWIFCGLKSDLVNCVDDEISRFFDDYRNKAIKITDLYDRHIRDNFIVEGHRNYTNYAEVERRGLENGLFLSKLRRGLGRLENLCSVRLSSGLWTKDVYEDRWGGVKPNTLHGPELGSPLIRNWNPLHLRPSGWNTDEMEYERSLICEHFYTLTAAMTETHRNIKSLEIPHGVEGGLPPQAFIRPAMTDDHFLRMMHAYSGLEALDISIDSRGEDDSNDPEALAALPRMLQQMTGLKKLKLDLRKDVDTHPSCVDTIEHYTYQQVFPTLALWRRLTEISIKGLAIGGWDLMCLLRGRAKVTDLTLHCIELLDGTWEGVVEALCHARMDELNLGNAFKHRGGRVFLPHKTMNEFSDPQVLRAIEEYVLYGGRHPCLAPDDDPETPTSWYFNLMSDEEFENCKTFARELDKDFPRVDRFADGQTPGKLQEYTASS